MDQGFNGFGIIGPILRALQEAQFNTPTPVQSRAIPPGLAGSDILGCAQTGSGKTAAFVIPLLQRLSADTRQTVSGAPAALILAPGRDVVR